jgi:hypothetical protein
MPATTSPVEQIDWSQPGQYSAGPWGFEYTNKAPAPHEFQFGHLSYRGFGLYLDNDRINDSIRTPWGLMYWTGTWRHPWGYQGWEPKPVTNEPAGKRLVPGQVLAMEINNKVYPVWRERLSDRLHAILGELPKHRSELIPEGTIQKSVSHEVIEAILRSLQRVLTEAPEYAAPKDEADLARQAAGVGGSYPVLSINGLWVVLIDGGHPFADGTWAIYVVRAKDGVLLRSVVYGGHPQPQTQPAS